MAVGLRGDESEILDRRVPAAHVLAREMRVDVHEHRASQRAVGGGCDRRWLLLVVTGRERSKDMRLVGVRELLSSCHNRHIDRAGDKQHANEKAVESRRTHSRRSLSGFPADPCDAAPPDLARTPDR